MSLLVMKYMQNYWEFLTHLTWMYFPWNIIVRYIYIYSIYTAIKVKVFLNNITQFLIIQHKSGTSIYHVY